MRTFARFGAKKLQIFRNLCYARTDKGVEPVRTFCGQGKRESIFRDFVCTSFMDGPLQGFINSTHFERIKLLNILVHTSFVRIKWKNGLSELSEDIMVVCFVPFLAAVVQIIRFPN